MSIASFIFGGNTGVSSAQDLQRERDLVDALMQRQYRPKTIGEGLSAIGDALATRGAASCERRHRYPGHHAGSA